MNVYLAGPIRGLTYQESTDWREFARLRLNAMGHTSMSPMRGKEYLKDKGVLLGSDGQGSFEEFPMSTEKGLFRRDIFDVSMSDCVLANLQGATELSIGTVMEIQRGYDLDKYVITVMEAGSIHDHPFVRQASSIFVPTLEYALEVLKVVGDPYSLVY